MRAAVAVSVFSVVFIPRASCVFEFKHLLDLPRVEPADGADADIIDGRRFASELNGMLRNVQQIQNAPADTSYGTNMEAAPSVSAATPITDKKLFVEAQALMENASQIWEAKEEAAIRQGLKSAMQAAPSTGDLDGTSSMGSISQSLETIDFFKCPPQWQQHGSICSSDADHPGNCEPRIDLAAMSVDQKLALERFCNVRFPRVAAGQCDIDFDEHCPSAWRTVATNICEAPAIYSGPCGQYLNTSGMTLEDKMEFGMQCDASWPCAAPPLPDYETVCPDGWLLQSSTLCIAPKEYEGPCAPTSDLKGLSIAEKQRFKEFCNVSWPQLPSTCQRNYDAPCPYGWDGGVDDAGSPSCTAPSTYTSCSRVKSFASMTPSEKKEWEHSCNARFPCIDRSRPDCSTQWRAPCPAEWTSIDAGQVCVAPARYTGECSLVLRGLLTMSVEEKQHVASSCNVSWPCFGEVMHEIHTPDPIPLRSEPQHVHWFPHDGLATESAM